jgi:hypothetical protein
MAGSEQDRYRRSAPESPAPASPERRSSWSRGARLLTAAALVVLALGVGAITVTLSHPDRLGVAFSGGGRDVGPTVPVAAQPGGADAAESAAESAAEPAVKPAAESAAESVAESAAGSAADQAVTAPLAGRRRATFELVDGLTTLDLRVADLGEDLYRISAPADGGVVPEPEVLGERVQLHLRGSGRRGPAAVEVRLNSRVTWRLRQVGAVTEQVLDLTAARLAGIEFVGASTRTELRLPRVTGTLAVRMTGGVNELLVGVTGATPVRIRVGAGAGSVAAYDERRVGVAAGDIISSPDWDRSADRVDVDLVAGANTVTVGAG